jgi:hypothetical protein
MNSFTQTPSAPSLMPVKEAPSCREFGSPPPTSRHLLHHHLLKVRGSTVSLSHASIGVKNQDTCFFIITLSEREEPHSLSLIARRIGLANVGHLDVAEGFRLRGLSWWGMGTEGGFG